MTSLDEKRLLLPHTDQSIEAQKGSTVHDVAQASFSSSTGDVHIGDNLYASRSRQEELNEYLARVTATYKGRMYQKIASFIQPSSPYKLLSSFRVEDESIFFGRAIVTEELSKKVLHNRLTVLYAKSGTGKTSLLNAGLSPYLIRSGRLPLYVQTYDKDPVWIIKQTLAPTVQGLWPDLLRDLSLHGFLAKACDLLKRDQIEEIVLLLDQFEDFFLYRPQQDGRFTFLRALGDCYLDQNLPIRIVLALRSDYYSELADFDQVLPSFHIFHNYYRLRSMTQNEAREAIVEPLRKFDTSVVYDSVLLDSLINDLDRGEVELPLLQIICTRLYETRGKKKPRITLKMYQALGETTGVLTSYLNEVLAGLPYKEKDLAKSILQQFVRSDATKQTLSYKILLELYQTQKDMLDRILIQLTRDRLLRLDDIEGETRYELVHDYLALEIARWINPTQQAFKRAEELLRRELLNWNYYEMLIPHSRLEMLYPYRNQFRKLEQQEWECLVLSALEEGYAVEDWIQASGEFGVSILVKVLEPTSKQKKSRLAAIQYLLKFYPTLALEPLIVSLMDEDTGVRQIAANALGTLGDVTAIKPLVTSLQDKEVQVRLAAIEALVTLGDATIIKPLTTSLKDRVAKVRLAAARALETLGDATAVKPLIVSLMDQDAGVRQAAARALERLNDATAVGPLIASLQDKEAQVRQAAVRALGMLDDDNAVKPLIALLRDEDAGVRQAAVDALGILGDVAAIKPLITSLKDEDAQVRLAAVEALEKLGGATAIEPLITSLQDKDAQVRLAAVEALEKLGGVTAIEPLITSRSAGVRQAAVDALGILGDAAAIKPLITSLKDKDAQVRLAAVEALEKLGDDIAIKPLIESLTDQETGVRQAAARALGRLGDSTVVKPLIASLTDKKSGVRRAAASILGRLGDATAVKPLIVSLKDKEAWVRLAAVEALGELGDVTAIEPLITSLIKDENVQVRLAAVDALEILGDASAIKPLIVSLQDEAWVRRAAASTLGRLGDATAVKPLIVSLKDKEAWVRLAAVEALGELGDVTAIEPLIDSLQDQDTGVRQAAVKALGELGDVTAVKPLIVSLKDEDDQVRWAAARALGRLDYATTMSLLIASLKDEDPRVCQAAAKALGILGDAAAVKPLITSLNDNRNAEVRQAAAIALLALKDTISVKLLAATLTDVTFIKSFIAGLKDEDAGVRQVSAQMLGMLGDDEAVKPLIASLTDENFWVRRAAFEALKYIQEE